VSLERFGPFFELATADAGDGGDRHSLAQLSEPGLLAERVEYARATIEARSPDHQPVTRSRSVGECQPLVGVSRMMGITLSVFVP
jgi:hypothetical protein